MESELNELNFNNANITFTGETDNAELSDELLASPLYQEQMGTNYSKRKKIAKAVTIAGLSISFTAIAVAGGSVLANAFITNPPTVTNVVTSVEGNAFLCDFEIKNDRGYKVFYTVELNDKVVMNEECSVAMTYSIEYAPVSNGDEIYFHIDFTNSFDYKKTIHQTTLIVGGNNL